MSKNSRDDAAAKTAGRRRDGKDRVLEIDVVVAKITERDEGIPGVLGTPDARPTGESAADGDDAPRGDGQEAWTTTGVAAERERLESQIRAAHEAGGEKAALDLLLAEISRYADAGGGQDRLRGYLAIVAALRHGHLFGGVPRWQIEPFHTLGEGLLKAQGIDPVGSRLGHLFGDLRLLQSQAESRGGDHLASLFEQQYGHFLGKRQPSGGVGFQALAAALRLLRLGHTSLALDGFATAHTCGLAPEHAELARLSTVMALRLRGDDGEALTAIRKAEMEPTLSPTAQLELAWEEALLKARREQDFVGIVALVQRGRPHCQPTYQLEAHLWARAVGRAEAIARLPKAATIRRAAGDLLRKGGPHAFLYECVALLETCHDTTFALAMRLREARTLVTDLGRLGTIDRHLLALAATTRWLARSHQPVLAAAMAAEYKTLSQRVTDGRSADALRVLSDLKVEAWGRHLASTRHFVDETPTTAPLTGSFARAATVGALGANVATSMIRSRIRGMTRSPEEQRAMQQRDLEELGAVVTRYVGRLKGPIMKAVQAMSYVPGLLPEAFRTHLSQITDTAQPVHWNIMRTALERSLGRTASELFTSIGETPIAAGSIGQVHAAVLRDGRQVAVKIRYPRVHKLIDSDVRVAGLIASIARRHVPGLDMKLLLKEMRRYLLEECDYRNEASNQEMFRRLAPAGGALVVPATVPELCTDEVLVSELLVGQRFFDFVASSSTSARDRAGVILFDANLRALLRYGVFHADPHPGNYLFIRPRGSTRDEDLCVGLVDFGFVRRFEPSTINGLRDTFRGAMADDFATFAQGVFQAGWVSPGAMDDAETMFKVVRTYVMRGWRADESVRFSQELVASQIRGATVDNVGLKSTQFPMDFVALDRLTWGLGSLLAVLESEANWWRILQAILAEPTAYAQTASAS